MPFYNVTSVTLSRLNSINAIEVECPLVHWSIGDIFGISLGYFWDIFGISLGYLWDIFGISLGYRWDIFGQNYTTSFCGMNVGYR
jgi:hypothetical protein